MKFSPDIETWLREQAPEDLETVAKYTIMWSEKAEVHWAAQRLKNFAKALREGGDGA